MRLFRGKDAMPKVREIVGPCRMRAPHHTCSVDALRGRLYRTSRHEVTEPPRLTYSPGEIALADRGYLLLDELAEWRSDAIEAVSVAIRIGGLDLTNWLSACMGDQLFVPVLFDVVATAHDCPCGRPDNCVCSDGAKHIYEARVNRFVRQLSEAWISTRAKT